MKKSIVLAFVLIGVVALARASPAMGHAFLKDSDPVDGAELQSAPLVVVLLFSENVTPLADANSVRDINGNRVDSGDVVSNGADVRIGLDPLTTGSYVLNWSVASSDGHPIRGTLAFAVGESLNPAIRDVAPTNKSDWPGPAAALARGAGYLAALLAIGFAAFSTITGSRGDRNRWTGALGGAVVVTAVLVLMAESLQLVDGDVASLTNRATWEGAWDTRHLPGALFVATGGLAMAARTMAPNRWVDFIAGTASCALIATGLAWTGHPAALDPRWLGIGLNATHVLAVGTWFGGLGALALAVRRPGEPETVAGLLERFSRVATVTFPLAVATGLALAWQVIPGWDDLVETGYGRLLIAKVAFVAMAGAAAFVHRRRTVDAVRRTGGSRPAIRLLAVEIAFLAVAIGLTATLTGRPPEASISSAEDTSAPFSTDRFVEPYHAILGLAPGKAGSNTLTVDLHDLDPLNSTPPAAVEARVSFGEGRAGPASYSLGHVLGPRWEAEISLLQAGDWSLTLVITLPDGEQEELELVVPIGR